jgi:hypothetical protein
MKTGVPSGKGNGSSKMTAPPLTTPFHLRCAIFVHQRKFLLSFSPDERCVTDAFRLPQPKQAPSLIPRRRADFYRESCLKLMTVATDFVGVKDFLGAGEG